MTRAELRKEFEEAALILNPVDLMVQNPRAERDCRTCKGYGIVDAGFDTGCILIPCPDCWREWSKD